MSSKKDGVILQVRLDSTRLPGKALLPLGDLTVVEHAMRALGRLPVDLRVLACDQASAGALEEKAKRWGFELFIGPKEDVLRRYLLVVQRYDIGRCIRATGDNPLVSAALAGELLDLQQEGGWDYTAHSGGPLGSGVELISSSALAAADSEASDPYEREHVAPFLYRRPERFSIHRMSVPDACRAPNLRLTLDTREDYHFLSELFHALYRGEVLECREIVSWYRQQEPVHG